MTVLSTTPDTGARMSSRSSFTRRARRCSDSSIWFSRCRRSVSIWRIAAPCFFSSSMMAGTSVLWPAARLAWPHMSTSATGVNDTPSSDRDTTLANPRPSPTGRRSR